MWTIDEVTYQGNMVYNYNNPLTSEYSFLVNVIYFNDDNSCELPVTDEENPGFETGKWKLISENDTIHFLNIETPNPVFNGKYRVKFYFENIDVLMMQLLSEKTIVICRKGSWKD